MSGRLWRSLFDDDDRQRRDIEHQREGLEAVQVGLDCTDSNVTLLQRHVERMEEVVARQELALEALVALLEQRAGITHAELALMIQRIDLADGVEDGRLGPDLSAQAPQCPICGRPINPRRAACLFCEAKIVPTAEAAAKPVRPQRTTTCTACGRQVPEQQTYFSDSGVVCDRCFKG